MALSTFASKWSEGPRARAQVVAAALAASVLLWDSSALAINAIVSQDLPLLTQIAATEAASYLELGAILSQTAAIVSQVKEYTTIAKTAWGALDELQMMTFDQLKDAALIGLNNAYPGVGQMYGDVHKIQDLNYRDYRAFQTLRGMLWEKVYGPAIDYLHTGHASLDAVAAMEEHRYRQTGKIEGRRAQLETWEEDCARTSAGPDGAEGACQGAANRAAIQQALVLSDLHETSLHILTAEQRRLESDDRRELDGVYAFQRWLSDVENYMAASSGAEETCPAGQCLYQRYGNAMHQRISRYRARHPEQFTNTIRRSTERQ